MIRLHRDIMTTISLSSNTAWSLFNFRGGLIRSLIDRHHRVCVIAPRDEFSSRLAGMGCDVLDIRIDNKGVNPMLDVRTLFDYLLLYLRLRPDVALHYTVKANIYGSLAARMLGVPCVNNVSGLGTAFIHESWVTRVVELLYRLSQARTRKLFFQNVDDLDLFVDRRLATASRMEALPGEGVDLMEFQVAAPANNAAPVFLLIARMLGDKGIREFVEAACRVKIDHPNARFQMLGFIGVPNNSSIAREEIENWSRKGFVEYLGQPPDVRPFIESANCIVLPSYREGLPRTLLEAAAMGRPIIATDVPGCRSVVDDGVNGYLCKARDSDDLAEKMRQFLALSTDEQVQMGLRGRTKMVSQFDEQIVISRYLEVISRIVQSGRGT